MMDNRGSISWKTSSPVESKGFRSTNLCFLFVLFFFFALVAIPVPALPNSGNQESHHAHTKKNSIENHHTKASKSRKLSKTSHKIQESRHTATQQPRKVTTQNLRQSPFKNPRKSPHRKSPHRNPRKKAARILTSFAIVACVLSSLFVCK